MKLQLVAIGTRMPDWITAGFVQYQRRFPPDMPFKLTEISAGKRGKNVDISRVIRQEGESMLAAIPKGNHIVSLDLPGKNWTTKELATQLNNWRHQGCDVSLLIGGPEGLAPACKQAASQSWCLSALTLPHPLVRVMVAESLYRALSLNNNHPYHRE